MYHMPFTSDALFQVLGVKSSLYNKDLQSFHYIWAEKLWERFIVVGETFGNLLRISSSFWMAEKMMLDCMLAVR